MKAKRFSSLGVGLLVSLAVLLAPSSGLAAPSLDQSCTAPTNLGAAINEGFTYVAQTFTAGRTGILTGVNVDIGGAVDQGQHLQVAIQAVAGGVPTRDVLAATVLPSSQALLADLVTFDPGVFVTSGEQYAIVATYLDAPPHGGGQGQGDWGGAQGNPYSGGTFFFSNDEVSWRMTDSGDLHFQTYVDAGGPELAPNPGFEGDLAGSWRGIHERGGIAAFTTTNDAYSGSQAAVITAADDCTSLARYLSERIPVVAGHTYRFGAFLRAEGVQGEGRVDIAFFDQDGNYIPDSSRSSADFGQIVTDDTGWTNVGLTERAADGATSARLEVRLYGTGTLSVDDASLIDE